MSAKQTTAKASKTPFLDYKSAALPTELCRQLRGIDEVHLTFREYILYATFTLSRNAGVRILRASGARFISRGARLSSCPDGSRVGALKLGEGLNHHPASSVAPDLEVAQRGIPFRSAPPTKRSLGGQFLGRELKNLKL